MKIVGRKTGLFLIVAGSFCWPLLLVANTDKPRTRDDWSALKSGEEVFNAACVTCHGSSGSGSPRAVVEFDIPLPDFTDCSFGSREPRADWAAIAHDGGPARSFDTMMPSFSGALTDDQLAAAVDHLKSFCRDPRWPDGEHNLPRALVTTKAFPEDEIAWEFSATTSEPLAFVGHLVMEKRVGRRHQLEAVLPFGVQQVASINDDGDTEYRWGEGVGDIVLGWKGVLWHNRNAGTIGSLATEVALPTGDEQDDFGKGIVVFEPFLAVGQSIPHVGFVQLQGGAELSTNLSVADHEVFWRGAFGREFQRDPSSRVFAPIVEILGKAELGDETEIAWDIVPQLFVTLSQRQHVIFSAGAKIPLTEFDDRPIQVMAYLLWDTYDGGFLEGWK